MVEKAIAELVDSLRQTQQMALKCSGGCNKLGDVLSQLKGRIPKEMMPPGAAGDDGEEDEPGKDGKKDDSGEPKLEDLVGMKEAGTKDGQEMEVSLSPDEAGRLLDGFKLGGNRRLPMNGTETGQPRDRKLRNW